MTDQPIPISVSIHVRDHLTWRVQHFDGVPAPWVLIEAEAPNGRGGGSCCLYLSPEQAAALRDVLNDTEVLPSRQAATEPEVYYTVVQPDGSDWLYILRPGTEVQDWEADPAGVLYVQPGPRDEWTRRAQSALITGGWRGVLPGWWHVSGVGRISQARRQVGRRSADVWFRDDGVSPAEPWVCDERVDGLFVGREHFTTREAAEQHAAAYSQPGGES